MQDGMFTRVVDGQRLLKRNLITTKGVRQRRLSLRCPGFGQSLVTFEALTIGINQGKKCNWPMQQPANQPCQAVENGFGGLSKRRVRDKACRRAASAAGASIGFMGLRFSRETLGRGGGIQNLPNINHCLWLLLPAGQTIAHLFAYILSPC